MVNPRPNPDATGRGQPRRPLRWWADQFNGGDFAHFGMEGCISSLTHPDERIEEELQKRYSVASPEGSSLDSEKNCTKSEKAMQGTIMSVAATGGQGLILGDDGTRYTYTPMGWRDPTVGAWFGMRVDFEIRGAHAVGLYPLPRQAPPPPSPPIATPVAPSPFATQPPPQQTTGVPAAPVNPVSYQAPVPPPPPQAAYPYQAGQAAPGQQYQPAKQGSIGAAVAWIFGMDILFGFISAVISIIPILGMIIAFVLQFVPGFIGGRKAGNVQEAMLAALILTAIYTVLSFIIVYAVIETLKGMPLVGNIVGMLLNLVGGSVFVFVVALVILDAISMFIGALIGSATKK